MTRSRDTYRVRISGTRNLARVVVAGIVLAGSSLALAGTANAAVPSHPAMSPVASVTPTASDDVWDQIAQCESGGKWNTSTGNGYSGGLQFSPSTWRAYGGHGSANGASRTEQIAVAQRVVARQGWGAWPVCSRKAHTGGRSSTTREVSTATRQTHTAIKSAHKVSKKATRSHHLSRTVHHALLSDSH